ncbi:MAG: hypothetical protein KDD10_07440 [Phaeodactylibacter sp.]|nr:hypothetical protein [Phaeodactylibacter sp.]MCB9297275.1 hypothetical protein [Lewinellaceae bacterium]
MDDKLDYRETEGTDAGFSELRQPQGVFAAEIIFGSPKKDCAGAGICKVNSPTAHNPDALACLNCQRATALISLGPAPEAVFRFVKSSMSKAIKEKYFSDGFFLVEAPFQFGKGLWKGPGLCIVQPGVYPVEKTEDYLVVRFIAGHSNSI